MSDLQLSACLALLLCQKKKKRNSTWWDIWSLFVCTKAKIIHRMQRVHKALQEGSLSSCPVDVEPELGACSFVRYQEIKFFLHTGQAPEDMSFTFAAPWAFDQSCSSLVQTTPQTIYLDQLDAEILGLATRISFEEKTEKKKKHPLPTVVTAPLRKDQYHRGSSWLPAVDNGAEWMCTVCIQTFPDAPIHKKKTLEVHIK
jgi:hypothetical protein